MTHSFLLDEDSPLHPSTFDPYGNTTHLLQALRACEESTKKYERSMNEMERERLCVYTDDERRKQIRLNRMRSSRAKRLGK